MKKWIISLIAVLGFTTLVKAQKASIPYNMDELSAYSIFLENYKSQEYNFALQYGRWMLYKKPRSIKGYSKFDLPTQFDRIITIYTEIAKTKDDPTVHTTYLDSALMVYDMALDTFKDDEIDKFDWRLQKARFYQKNADYLSDASDKAFSIYKDLFTQDPEKMAKAGEGYYLQITIQNMVSAGKKDSALAMIKKSEPYATDKLKNYFDKVRNQLFSSPKERMTFLEGQLKDDPKNTKVLNELVDLYTDQEMYDKARQTAEKLYNINPNFENTRRLADIALDNANYKTAIKYLKEAKDKSDDKDKLKKVALDLSDSYKNIDQLQTARNYARQAAKYDPNWGQPYIKISGIYAQAINDCTSGRKMTREDKAVYWLVLDYLDKARSVDSSVANTVKQQYQTYKPVTPTTEDKFFIGWKKGQKLQINGKLNQCYSWINETTTVR